MVKSGALFNTASHYGAVSKTFHWLTALLIITAFALGLAANNWPTTSLEAIQTKFMLFSMHKTTGLTVFIVSLVRIAWAINQPRPGSMNVADRWQFMLAETVYWALYISLVMVPLSGWLHHAAADGFAPIWWPFGQRLPFVPVNATLAELFSSMHWVFTKVMALAIMLHIAGALKHHLIDHDDTLKRMLPGEMPHQVLPRAQSHAPVATAASLYVLAMIAGLALWNMQRAPDADLNGDAPVVHRKFSELEVPLRSARIQES